RQGTNRGYLWEKVASDQILQHSLVCSQPCAPPMRKTNALSVVSRSAPFHGQHGALAHQGILLEKAEADPKHRNLRRRKLLAAMRASSIACRSRPAGGHELQQNVVPEARWQVAKQSNG